MTFLYIGCSLCTAQRSTGEDVSGAEMQPLLSYQRPFSEEKDTLAREILSLELIMHLLYFVSGFSIYFLEEYQHKLGA